MDIGLHDLAELVGQLGLENDEQIINRFIESRQVSSDITFLEAPFWNPSQVELLQQAFTDDAEWAEAADVLATLLTASCK